MQTIEIWKRSVVVGAVFAILADIYFSRLHASYTNLVLTGPSIVAPSETEAAIAVQYLKPSLPLTFQRQTQEVDIRRVIVYHEDLRGTRVGSLT